MKALAPLSITLCLVAASLNGAEPYRGRINVTGEVQNEAKPGSVSLSFSGRVRGVRSRHPANVSGGGLFRSTSDAAVDAVHTGRMKTYTRTANLPTGQRGRLIRRTFNTRVKVGARLITWPGGRIVLSKPLSADRDEVQKFRASGRYEVRL